MRTDYPDPAGDLWYREVGRIGGELSVAVVLDGAAGVAQWRPMMSRPWVKRFLLILATGTPLALGFNGCLDMTFQRILVGVLV